MKKQASVGSTVTGKSFYWKKRRELCHNTCTCTCTCIYIKMIIIIIIIIIVINFVVVC